MIYTKTRMRICIALLVANVVFIWGNSLLPAQTSEAFSQWVSELLSAIFGESGGEEQTGTGLLRKLAHFFEFCTLGGLLCWLIGMFQKPKLLSLLCGFSVACTDEFIQCFVPERGPAVKDVLIDTAGVAAGIGILVLGYAIYKKIKNNNHLEETTL
jgi:VanZ family protein